MSDHSYTRRDFLKTAGLTLVAGMFACSGLGLAATRTPQVEIPLLVFGKENLMNKRLLVAYATKAGSTAEIAAAIGEHLGRRGFEVDVKPLKEKPTLNGYQSVILGSAIRMGNWLPEAVDFVKTNQQILNTLPVALFTVHLFNTGQDETSTANRLAYLNSVRPLLTQAEEVYFEGKMDYSQLSLIDRYTSSMVKAVEADNRDWEKIHNWAQTVFA